MLTTVRSSSSTCEFCFGRISISKILQFENCCGLRIFSNVNLDFHLKCTFLAQSVEVPLSIENYLISMEVPLRVDQVPLRGDEIAFAMEVPLCF